MTGAVGWPASPGAIFFNTTSTFSPKDPSQKSWLYVASQDSNDSAFASIDYFMPWIPPPVAAGSSGYLSYSAGPLPALSVSVKCTGSDNNPWDQPSVVVASSGHNITIGPSVNGTAAIKVMMTNGISWECSGSQGTSLGNVSYSSDTTGKWSLTSLDMNLPKPTTFTTDPARWQYIALILLDTLGLAANAVKWNFSESTSADSQYSEMLVATRMTFATALLCFGENRTVSSSNSVQTSALEAISKVQILNNWALSTTTALLYLLTVMTLYHLLLPTEFLMDFNLLQVMEMQQNTPMVVAPILSGHCVETPKDAQANMEVSIRANLRSNHLGMLRFSCSPPREWIEITRDTECT